MEKIYAFTDESGSFGWELDNENTSTHFIITAIIVKESDVDTVRTAVAGIRDRYFPKGEIKSSKIGKKHNRRKKILEETLEIPYQIFAIVVNKESLKDWNGLSFKKSFYKFMNNIVHKELRAAFKNLVVVADEIGGSDYMQSFCRYDEHKKDANVPDYQGILKNKIIRIEQYPKMYDNYDLEKSALASEYDKDIAEICLHQAIDFINTYKDDDSEIRQGQLIVLKSSVPIYE